ncbi:MAG TPA: PQQ-binding-like beta-propeller repeat protein, partial [Flavobacterium sp.]|nr:PQQ-binding-like beta-propeller repeat protein [Flavobacterium sp.]
KSNNENNNQTNKANLTEFAVRVIERTPLAAVIQWDSSKNKINNELVRYRIILGGVKIKDSLTLLTDTLLNLEKNKIYSGKVVAFITSDTTFSEFTLSTYDGQLYAHTKGLSYTTVGRFGGFNAYPVTSGNQPTMWRFGTDNLLTPTLSNDTIFMVSNSTLQAINAITGGNIWQGPANISFVTSVTYSAGRLYACSNTGTLVCVNSSTGQVLWNYTSATYGNFNSNPVIDNNLVFVAPVNRSSGEVHAVNAITGQKVWSYGINNSICKRPLATKGVVVISSGPNGHAFALDAATGNLLWNKTDLLQVGSNEFNPVYLDGKVLVSTTGAIYALDLKTGIQKWRYEGGGGTSYCVTGNDMVYFCQDTTFDRGSYGTHLKAISAKDGHRVWSQNVGSYGSDYSNLVFAKDKVYATIDYIGFAPRLVTFNATTGKFDINFANNNTVPLNLHEGVNDFIIKRDGIVYYPSTHGNYQ